jgi:hypothetical protein
MPLLFRKTKARYAPSSVMVFVLNPFKPDTLLQQRKRVSRKRRSLLKFLTAKNDSFLGRYECIPSSSTQMTSLSFALRMSHFLLKL